MKNNGIRFVSVFMVLVSLFFCIDFSANASSYTPPSLSGSTYTVSSASHLKWISGVCSGAVKKGSEKYPSNSNFKGYTIVLKNNISLGTVENKNGEYVLKSGEVWTPIGTETTPFSGVFNGKGFSVDGVFVNNGNSSAGFFGVIEKATISDLTVKGFVCGKGKVGGIVATGKGQINGCIFSGRIDGEGEVGGIIGTLKGESGYISNLYLNVAACEINSFGGDSAGGIVGTAIYSNITSCSGGVNLYSKACYSGGILGISHIGVKISCCNSDGTITGDGKNVVIGGIVGLSVEYTELVNNSFGGMAYASAESYACCGGIAGNFIGKIENSFVNGGVYSSLYFTEGAQTGKCFSAGLVGESNGTEINNCYFSGLSECKGQKGDDVCSSGSVNANNTFYSYGTAYILYGTDEVFHVMALLDKLKGWTDSKTGYSTWMSISGVNDSKPLLKHTNAAGSDGKHAWKSEGTVFTFYTDGAMDDYQMNNYGIINTPWAVYRSGVKTVNVKNGVTRIGNNAFSGFEYLSSLTLPSTLKTIGDGAFEQCVRLKDFTFPSFVEDIGEAAFRRCKTLTKVTLPKNIRSVRKSTFAYCEKLSTISIPDSVSLIGYMAFSMCDALTTVTLPASVKEIDDYAFYYCDNLTTVSFPSGLNRIGSYAFGRCELLVNFEVPIKTITGEYPFWSSSMQGDVNGDGVCTSADYLNIKAHLVGKRVLVNKEKKSADADYNGIVTTSDYLLVKNSFIGK